jgi:hypothetical protein
MVFVQAAWGSKRKDLVEIYWFRKQEIVDRPRADRDVGVHNDDAASRLQHAECLIKEIPNVLKMVKGIKHNNVRKTALGKWELLRIHDSI